MFASSLRCAIDGPWQDEQRSRRIPRPLDLAAQYPRVCLTNPLLTIRLSLRGRVSLKPPSWASSITTAPEKRTSKGLADGQEVRTSFSHRFRPLSVGLLIAEMEEDDLLSMVVNELNRIDPIPDQPVQVGAQLDIRNPRQSALES